MTKVALVMFSSGLGGTERRMLSLARLLRDQEGQDLTLIYSQEIDQAAMRFSEFADMSQVQRVVLYSPFPLDISRHQLPAFKIIQQLSRLVLWALNWVCLSLQLAFAFQKIQPELIHVVLDTTILVFWPLSYLLPTPVVLSLVGDEIRDFERYQQMGLRGRVQAAAVRRLLTVAAQIDVLGPDLLEAIRGLDSSLIKKSTLLSSFVETDRFRPTYPKYKWVVYAHRFVTIKNPLLFLEAIPKVYPKHPDAHFFLLGQGPLEDQIRNGIQKLGLEEQVTVKFTDRVEDILAQSLIFTCLQKDENYPSRALLEAMACGNSTVATDVGYTYLLVNDQTGMRVPPDPDRLAAAINQLLDQSEQTVQMGRNARELVLREFGIGRYLDGLRTIYTRAINPSTPI